MVSYNVAEAKAHLSEILDRVSDGEEIILTRRGEPIARLVPAAAIATNILGAGRQDPNIDRDVLEKNEWWKAGPDEDSNAWYE